MMRQRIRDVPELLANSTSPTFVLTTFCAIVTLGVLAGDPTLYVTVRFRPGYCRRWSRAIRRGHLRAR